MSVRSPGVGSPAPGRHSSRRRPLEVAPPRLPFDVAEAKVRVPALRPDFVSRTPLVNRLRAASVPVVVCVSPAGYGKTTLLAQWAGRDPRDFAWVSVDERDNAPAVLLQGIAAALDRSDPLPDDVLAALRRRGESIWLKAAPRLASAIATRRQPFVLVLDDVDLLDGESMKAISLLIENIPEGSGLAFTGRVPPQLPIARLRAHGLILEIGADDLALNAREVKIVLQSAEVDLEELDVEGLVRRSEGWAAGVYLTALAFQHGRDAHTSAALRGDDRYLAEFFESEYLSRLSPRQRTFLRRTAVLGRLSGSLCDSVLERTGSGRELASIQRANLFLVPLDDHGSWYRYHHLFRDMLLRELIEREPEKLVELNRRAADWFEANGRAEEALHYADASGDHGRAARILATIVMKAYDDGRVTDVEDWLEPFDDDQLLERYAGVAVHGSRVHALRGRRTEAERWLGAAELRLSRNPRARGADVVSGAADVVRAWMCASGAEQMRAEADRAVAALPATSHWRSSALVLRAVALVLLGEENADEALARAAEIAARSGAAAAHVLALAERALLASDKGDAAEAAELASTAETIVQEHGLDAYACNALRLVASGRTKLRAGNWQGARNDLDAAHQLIPAISEALPWLAAQTRLELARASLAMRDAATARELVVELDRSAIRIPKFEALRAQRTALVAELAAADSSSDGKSSGLTDAELRLLPLLATHLSFREIGERLFVSRNTIKTQAISVYRKLGVSSRSDAIDRASQLGLIATSPDLQVDGTH